MHLPFYVSCGRPGAGLFELSDGRFQKIEAGVLAPWCQGYGYLLVERTLADFLEAAEIERVRYEPAIVFGRSRAADSVAPAERRVAPSRSVAAEGRCSPR